MHDFAAPRPEFLSFPNVFPNKGLWSFQVFFRLRECINLHCEMRSKSDVVFMQRFKLPGMRSDVGLFTDLKRLFSCTIKATQP